MAAVLLAARRARLLAVLAGLAWLLGLTPPVPLRVVLVVLAAGGMTLDALSDAALRPRPVRLTGWGSPRGGAR